MADEGDSDSDKKQLHIAVFPWLAFGHMIPFLHLSKQLAEKGHTVSFITTPRNINRLPKIPRRLSDSNLLSFVPISLPATENLPDEAEATSDLPQHQVPYLKLAHDGLEQELTGFLETRRPDWIIYDFAPHWLPSVAARLGIRKLYFSVLSAASLCLLSPSAMVDSGNNSHSNVRPEDLTVPPKWIPFPSNFAFRLHEAKRLLEPITTLAPPNLVSDLARCYSTISQCEAVAVRSCPEFESDWLNLANQRIDKWILPIGLLLPEIEEEIEEDEAWIGISEWLNKQDKSTVVYVAFGSETALTQEEIEELALGLESSGITFLWILKQEDLLPEGFRFRIQKSGCGTICSSWVPQQRILAHDSVGGYLTHSGWGSVIEALRFGVPLIMLPFQADQPMVARVCAEKELGIEIPRDEEDGFYSRTSVAETVRMVMVDEEGDRYRNNAKRARKDVFANQQIHDRCFDQFVTFLQHHNRKDMIMMNV